MNRTVKIIGLVGIGAVGVYFGYKQFKKIMIKIKVDMLNENHKEHIETLHPDVKAKFIKLLKHMEDLGYDVIITSSYRTFGEQADLKKKNSHNATAGHSKHNYGMAFDINLMKDGKIWKKATSKATWENTGIPQYARDLGFFWGGDYLTYHDPIHFEYPKGLKGTTLLDIAQKQFNTTDPYKIEGNKIKIPREIKRQYFV